MTGTSFSPLLQKDRIIAIDILRGIAVLGILIMNIQHFSMPRSAYINPAAYGDLDGWNKWIWILSHMLAREKFMSIFSLLFGAGIVLFAQRAEQKGQNSASMHYRRMTWLLVFGAMHAYLLWSGDILVSYALCGMLVFLFRNWSPRRLAGTALAFFLVPLILKLYFTWSLPGWPGETIQFAQDSWLPGAETLAHQLNVYRSGWWVQMELRVPGSMFMQTGYFFTEAFWRVTALMLLGMALYKWDILTCGMPSEYYRVMVLACLTAGYLLSGLGVYLNFKNGWHMEFSMFLGSGFNYVGSVGVALGYSALAMLFTRWPAGQGIKNLLASVGRMAFSNYILMTLLGTFIFYGHGLGLYGSMERKYQALLVPAIWLPVLVISHFWLKRFRFGPLEWLWRVLSYRSWK